MEDQIAGFLGLIGGMIIGILGWYFGRRKARNNRALDELYNHIWQKAKSYSWYVTLAVIYILFSLLLFGIEMSLPMTLGILLMAHLMSWAVVGTLLSIKYSIST